MRGKRSNRQATVTIQLEADPRHSIQLTGQMLGGYAKALARCWSLLGIARGDTVAIFDHHEEQGMARLLVVESEGPDGREVSAQAVVSRLEETLQVHVEVKLSGQLPVRWKGVRVLKEAELWERLP